MNTDSAIVITDSGKLGKSVHDGPEWLFTILRNSRSRSNGMGVHDAPEYALRSESLAATDKFLIYRDEQTLGAYQSLKTAQELELPGQSLTVELSPGATFRWDGRVWVILNAGEKNISLRGENDTYLDLPAERFQDLLKQGKIEVIKSDDATPKDSPAEEILLTASPEDLAEANKRYELIKPYINGNRVEPDGVSRRTIGRYLSAWKEGEQLYGNGFAGLIPKISGRGNRNQRLPDQTVQIINEYIEKDYETTRHGNMWTTAAKIQLKCRESGTVVPSYMAVVRAIRKRPVEQMTRKREGRRRVSGILCKRLPG